MTSNWERFKQIVDQAAPTIGPEMRVDFPKLYAHYGIPTAGAMSIKGVTDFLNARIRDLSLVPTPGVSGQFLKNIGDNVVGLHIISGQPLAPYLDLIEIIRDAARGEILSPTPRRFFLDLTQTPTWIKICSAALDIRTLNPTSYQIPSENLEMRFPRTARPAQRLAKLKSQGYQTITMSDGHFSVDQAEFDALVSSIEQKIRTYGGRDLVLLIFSAIDKRYDAKQERYHLGRYCNPLATGIVPQCPSGFLLNLAIKPANFIPGNQSRDLLLEIEESAISLGCLYGVQPYSSFELEFRSIDNLIQFLKEISLYDSLFTFPQLRPSDIPKFIAGLFDWAQGNDIEKKLGWPLQDAIAVTESLLKITPDRKSCVFLDSDIAPLHPKIPIKTLTVIMESFTHQPPAPNADLKTPADIPAVDFGFRPLVPLEGRRMLIDKSWCGAGFYEAIASILREAGVNGVDDKVGLAAERFIKSELSKKGVAHLSGKYKHGGMDGECDVVVETSDTIIFIEIKKKSLTRKSRGGSDVDLLLDISGSLIDSQVQLGGHELLIRDQGYIDLDADSVVTRLNLNGRKIERVSLSLLDYGGIQDRRVISQILSLVLTAQFTPADAAHKKKFDLLNLKCQELQQQAIRLTPPGAKHNIPYFNCWFLSIPQFLVLLDDVRSNEDLKQALWETRHISMGSLDFYRELSSAQDIRARAAKPPTGSP